MATWINNFAPLDNYNMTEYDNNTSIDELFPKKENNMNIIKMLELKGEIISLIQGKEEFDLEEEEEGIIKKESEKEENIEEIETFINQLKDYIKRFILLQNDINDCNDSFQKEVALLRKNISTTETMIEFIKKIPEDQKDQENIKLIIEQMNILSRSIMNNKKIKDIRKKYVEKRVESEKIIGLLKKVNNLNHCNICPLCFTNPVDHFIDPCGHTFCKECLKTHIHKGDSGEEGFDLYEIGRNDNSQCCFCRDRIKTVRPLYFL